MSFALEGENPSVGVDINNYGSTFDVVAKVDARMRITLTESGQQVWIGHARVVGEETSGGAAYGIAEGSSQATDITNRATDDLIADFALQLERSREFKNFFEGKKS